MNIDKVMKLSDNGNGELKHGKTTKSKRGKIITFF